MDHHASEVATMDPPVGQLYTTDEVAKLLRVSAAHRASLDPRRDAHGRALRTALAGAPGRSRVVRRGPAQAPPRVRGGREPQSRSGWRGAGVSPSPLDTPTKLAQRTPAAHAHSRHAAWPSATPAPTPRGTERVLSEVRTRSTLRFFQWRGPR
jgi:hypothetical protein